MVVLLRDPIQRVISHYRHACRLGFERLPLGMALEAEAGRLSGAEALLSIPGGRHQAHQELSYLARSRYHEQLDRYLRWFNRDQLLLLQSERLFVDPRRVCREITDFLDVEEHPSPDRLLRLASTSTYTVTDQTRRVLADALSETYQAMADRFGLNWPA